jgi:LacI family transcriptional regulator
MAEKGRITLKDIAELAGVSIGTVYRVLHNNGRFSDETKGKVLRIIEEHGYKSSLHASANSMRRRLKFVIVLPGCSDGDYWSCIKDGIVRAVADYGNIPLVLAGGVMSSTVIKKIITEKLPDAMFVKPQFSSDNAIGVAVNAYRKVTNG